MNAQFTEFVRAVARGRRLGRSLDIGEAERAMGMIMDGEATPEQVGAFLMVLRYRVETSKEIAGFVRAARKRMAIQTLLDVDLDWPSYADHHRQLPWFVLAARLLAENGVRIVMHGIEGAGTATTRAALRAMDVPVARDGEVLRKALDRGLVYVPLEDLCPLMQRLFDLKRLFGLRSCVHTMARELNPFGAPAQIQGVFHPDYLELHRGIQRWLDQPAAITFKGGGGEGQRNPCKPCDVRVLRHGESFDESWSSLTEGEGYPWREEPLDVRRLRALWQGEWSAEAPRRAVTGTAAMCLWLTRRVATPAAAESMAEAMWLKRAPLAVAA
ncbi:MAG: glycosyl transferase family protein [Geminicoccaceae bacterium]|nr:glycosyl transferase family protein [Geminicoccaceae bacterium]